MTNDVIDILIRCQETASWYGQTISGLDDRNFLGDTPLHTVCSWGDPDPVARLIAAGADVNAKGDHGCTPLFNAVIGENVGVLKLLVDAGADVMIRSADNKLLLEYARNTRAPPDVVAFLVSATKAGIRPRH